jgi:hypothetical protein
MVLILLVIIFLMSTAATTSATTSANSHFYRAYLRGSREVPGPGDPDGVGRALLGLNVRLAKICYELTARKILLPATGAHIHVGTSSQSGDIVVSLNPPNANGVSRGCVNAPRSLIRMIRNNPSKYYVNIHTTDFMGGAIRGQIMFPQS